MTDAERKARGERARMYRDEFLTPILTQHRSEYMERMATVATTELNARKRSEKITALSAAVRILDNIKTGIDAIVHDGTLAEASLLKAEKVERMAPSDRRLLDMVPRL